MDELIRLYDDANRKLGCRQLAQVFNRLYKDSRDITVGKTFVAEVIKAHLYRAARMSERYKHQVPEPVPRNATWGVDLTGKGDVRGVVHLILGVIDHGSRLALAMHVLPNRCSTTLLAALNELIAIYGKPQVIKTDNEACFTSSEFKDGLAKLGIKHQRSRPGMPWQNGRIERLFLTLKEKLDQLWVLDAVALQTALASFRFWYNDVRVHQHLNGRTPSEAWHGIDPYKSPVSVELFQAWDGLLVGYYMRR